MLINYILVISWLVSGAICFIYWWTTEFDYTINQIPLTILLSISGPLAFFFGSFIHNDKKSKIIISKRKPK